MNANIVETQSLFNPKTIRQIKAIQKVWPDSKLIITNATKEQIEQLKSEGLHGISRRQKVD